MRRVVAGIVLAVVGLGCVYNPYAFFVLVFLIGGGCLHELSRLCERKGQPLELPVALMGYIAYMVLAVAGLLHRYEGELLAAIVLSTLGLGMYGSHSGYLARTGYTLLGVLYIGKLLSYFIAIRTLPMIGFTYTIYVIVIIAVTDIAAMLIGTSVGRTPLTLVSPKKTIEGAMGALLVAVLVAVALGTMSWLHVTWWQAAVIGTITSLAAQAGDLVESALKRDARVKDAGSVIQGHGGLLDRFDSYLFGGIAFYGALFLTGLLPFTE
ncbi:MAG: phosphatidate cytidylyltransferase [Candidatus Eremiobacteraeota bacterium]|nr:phosphatidate cytidylyltransferase [Candidatus Eremiobacteraeota bacterium]